MKQGNEYNITVGKKDYCEHKSFKELTTCLHEKIEKLRKLPCYINIPESSDVNLKNNMSAIRHVEDGYGM